MKVNVILSFQSIPQLMLDIDTSDTVYQLEYIFYIFSMISTKELKQLRKISNMQLNDTDFFISWLFLQSKYYFDKKEDPFWYMIKKFYLEHGFNSMSKWNSLYKYVTISYHKNKTKNIENTQIINVHVDIQKVKDREDLIDLINYLSPKKFKAQNITCFKQSNFSLSWFPEMYFPG